MTVVPDSIEPYLGYKALRVLDDGRLASPQQNTPWPPRERLQAVCTASLSHWGWTPIEGEPRSTAEIAQVGPGYGLVVTAVVASSSTIWTQAPAPPRPNNPLPEGWSWSWEPHTHDAPSEGCHCGIYVVKEPSGCDHYMGVGCFIVEIAVWGITVTASGGARGQYAYPKQLLIPSTVEEAVWDTTQMYGIPALVFDDGELDPAVRKNLNDWAYEHMLRKEQTWRGSTSDSPQTTS